MGKINIHSILGYLSESASCVGCGCTDENACIDELGYACHWLKVNRDTGLGVCTCCPEFLSHPCTPDYE